MPDQTFARILLTIVTCATAALIIQHGGRFTGWAGLGVATAVIAGIAVLALARGAEQASRTHRHYVDEGERRDAALHEGAHAAVGKHVGGRIVAAEIHPDGSGWIDIRHPRSTTVAQHLAVCLAGARGEGADFDTARQCGGDRAIADWRMRGMSSAQRQATRAEAEQIADAGLAGQAATARRVARRLERDGSLS